MSPASRWARGRGPTGMDRLLWAEHLSCDSISAVIGGLWLIWSFVSVTVSTVAGLLGCELRVRKHARR